VARGAAPSKLMDLGETQAGGACLTEQRGWIASPDSEVIISFDVDHGEARPEMWPKHDLLGCSTTAALLQQRNASSFVVCAGTCRVAALQGMRPSKLATLVGDEVVSIAYRDQVLGVWREKGPPRFFALKAPLLNAQLALSDGKVIDLVAQSDDGMVILRVPTR